MSEDNRVKNKAPQRQSRMEVPPANSVNDYLKPLPRDIRASLENLRKTIRTAAPKAEETISYRMPAYKHHGLLVFFAAFKNHMSFFPGGRSINKKFSKELEQYEVSGTAIHFTVENPLPASLVKRIVKARIEENELRDKKK